MAIVNAHYDFIKVDVRANGRVSDGGVFSNTLLYEKLLKKQLCILESDNLPRTNVKMPYALVRDNDFRSWKI
jgi:hypothetical protein